MKTNISLSHKNNKKNVPLLNHNKIIWLQNNGIFYNTTLSLIRATTTSNFQSKIKAHNAQNKNTNNKIEEYNIIQYNKNEKYTSSTSQNQQLHKETPKALILHNYIRLRST